MRLLRLLFSVVLAVSFASSAFAIPIVNEANDKVEDRKDGSVFGYFQNSGSLLFIEKGNNLGNEDNLLHVQDLVRNAVGDKGLILSITDVAFTNYNIDGTISTDPGGTNSGTWNTIPSTGTIDFYAVKAANAFAMYAVNPAAGAGSWSTFHLWAAGYGGKGLQISHFTGYNPGTTSVPEPGTLLLLGSGLMGLGFFGRKKFKK